MIAERTLTPLDELAAKLREAIAGCVAGGVESETQTVALPTLEFTELVWETLTALGRPQGLVLGPPRPWQSQLLMTMHDQQRCSIQGARQGSGKTHTAAVYATACLLLGADVAAAMPTMRQGGRILLRSISTMLELLEPVAGLKRLKSGAEEIMWSNGARLLILSTSDDGLKASQGWTAQVVLVDESQELSWQDLGYFMPIVSVAMVAGNGRLILLGVGARATSAPERVKSMAGWICLTLSDEAISASEERAHGTSKWREFFAETRATSDAALYRQFYQSLPPIHGARCIFPRLSAPVAGDGSVFSVKPTYHLGIDVGRVHDSTVVAVFERVGTGIANLVDALFLPSAPFQEQAATIYTWVCTHYPTLPGGSCCVELNGPGFGLYDCLASRLQYIPNLVAVHMSAELKLALTQDLVRDCLQGKVGFADIPLGKQQPGGAADANGAAADGNPETVREHLEALTFDYGLDGVTRYEHSDLFSAILVARAGMQRVSSA